MTTTTIQHIIGRGIRRIDTGVTGGYKFVNPQPRYFNNDSGRVAYLEGWKD